MELLDEWIPKILTDSDDSDPSDDSGMPPTPVMPLTMVSVPMPQQVLPPNYPAPQPLTWAEKYLAPVLENSKIELLPGITPPINFNDPRLGDFATGMSTDYRGLGNAIYPGLGDKIWPQNSTGSSFEVLGKYAAGIPFLLK
jgi:hypothetical protein